MTRAKLTLCVKGGPPTRRQNPQGEFRTRPGREPESPAVDAACPSASCVRTAHHMKASAIAHALTPMTDTF